MKNFLVLLLVITGLGQGFSQNAKKATTGDDELDKSIQSITKYSRKNGETFRSTLVAKYSISDAQAAEYTAKYTGGDLFMIFETAKETGKKPAAVFAAFDKNRDIKGWNETLKDLGVKAGGKSFDAIKLAVVNNGLN